MYKKFSLKNITLLCMLILAGCTAIRKGICIGCLNSLSENEVKKYTDTSLANFMKDRFTDKLSQIDSSADYNKVDQKDGGITVRLLGYHIDRPYDDLSKFCSIHGGKFVLVKRGDKPVYRSLKEIKREAELVYQNAKRAAPNQITIDSGFGIQSTYEVDKNNYAFSQAQSHLYNEIKFKKEIENSEISRKYNAGKLGTFVCKRNGMILWGTDIAYKSTQKDGGYNWYDVRITPSH